MLPQNCEQVQPLFEYVDATRKTDRPLEIAGMDAQITGQDTPRALGEFLDSASSCEPS